MIEGGKSLSGEVALKGSKNAAFPVLAATVLAAGHCIIEQVPRIKDVENFVAILESMGAEAQWEEEHTLHLNTADLKPEKLDTVLAKKLRGSVLIMGALLGRFGKVVFPHPGGDKIGARSLDTHLRALQDMGATIVKGKWGAQSQSEGNEYEIKLSRKAQNREVILDEFSVTGTENALLVACGLPETTTLKLAAAEPHVQDLCKFLRLLGVKIEEAGAHTLTVYGKKSYSGKNFAGESRKAIKFRLAPDYLEAGTFLVAAAATRSEVKIVNAPLEHLDAVLKRARSMGVEYKIDTTESSREGTLLIRPSSDLRASRVQTMIYPGFPTDLQAPFGVLTTQAQGTSLIHDPLYEGRMKYIEELKKMGANAIIADPHRALVSGPTPLYGTEIDSLDIRSGATLVIAGLVAEGKTVINDAEIVDRGYEKIEERLQKLGAKIERV